MRWLERVYLAAPLAPVAVALVGGVAAETLIPWGGVTYLALAAGLLAAWTLLRLRRAPHGWSLLLLTVAAFLLGAWRIGLTRHAFSPDHIVHHTTNDGRLVDLRGRVESAPSLRTRTIEGFEKVIPRDPGSTFLLEADEIRPGVGSWQPADGLVRVVVSGPALQVSAGMRVELVGTLFPIPPPSNPGSPDWQRTSHDKRIVALLWVPAERGIVPIDAVGRAAGMSEGMTETALDLREQVRLHAHQLLLGNPEPLTEDDRLLLDGILLGRRSAGLTELTRPFVRTGTYHYLAVSGLHIGILAGFCWMLLRLARVRPTRSALTVLGIVAVYCLMAEPRPPILRAGIMVALLCIGLALRREVHPVNFLAAAAIILLMIDPGELFGAGFQLSFTVVLGLLLGAGPVHRWLCRWALRRDPEQPESAPPWIQSHPVIERLARFVLQLVAVSVVAWAAGFPLVAYHFGRVHPWAILASVMLWPVVWLVLVTGFAKMLLAAVIPTLGAWLNGPLHSASSLLMAVVRVLDALPASGVMVARPGVAAIVLYYAWLACLKWRPRWLRLRLLMAGGLAILVGTCLIQGTPEGDLAITLLDVGDGSAQVVRLPDDSALMVDAGSLEGGNLGERVIFPFLASTQATPGPLRPVTAFLSHPNLDHYSGLSGLAESGVLRNVIRSPSPGRDGFGVRQLLEQLRSGGVEVRAASAGFTMDRAGVQLQLLWPPRWIESADAMTLNDSSQVIRVKWNGRSALFAGDIMEFAQQRLLDGHAAGLLDLKADVLIMPHHGGVVENTNQFVRAVDPSVVLVSTRRDPREIMDRCPALRDPGRRVCFTSRDGALTVRVTAGGELTVRAMLADPPRTAP